MFHSETVDIVGEGHAFYLVDVGGYVGTAYSRSSCHIAYFEVRREIEFLVDKEFVEHFAHLSFLHGLCTISGQSEVVLTILYKLLEREVAGKPNVAQRKKHDGEGSKRGEYHPVTLRKVVPP